jgi:hypothetical protein
MRPRRRGTVAPLTLALWAIVGAVVVLLAVRLVA